jgi:hypothetical protein
MALNLLAQPQDFTWVKGPNGQWMRSDAYNPDTGKMYFPEHNGGQTTSTQFNSTPAQSSDPFVLGGSSSNLGMGSPVQQTAPQPTQMRGNDSDIAKYIRGLDWSAGGATESATKSLFEQAQKQGWTDAQIGNAMGFTPDQVSSHWQKFGHNRNLNPFQSQMFDSVTNQVTDNLNRNILPGLRSAATATGGYGGSRQGVVEANALKDANQGLSNTLGSIQYGDWNNYQNRMLQNKGMDQSYNLGMTNANNSFYTAQRGQDLQQTDLGARLYSLGTGGLVDQGQGVYNLGLTQQQAPWQTLAGFNNVSSPYTGYGSTSGTQAGSPLANAAGGAMMGGQMYQAWKGNAGTPSTGTNMSYAPGMQPTNAMSYF